jgi:hypothetical protein
MVLVYSVVVALPKFNEPHGFAQLNGVSGLIKLNNYQNEKENELLF